MTKTSLSPNKSPLEIGLAMFLAAIQRAKEKRNNKKKMAATDGRIDEEKNRGCFIH